MTKTFTQQLRSSFDMSMLSLAIVGYSSTALAQAPDWHQLAEELNAGIEDRTSVFNDFFNDEAPQAHPTGWGIPNSRFMAIAQGSHLWMDRTNQSNPAWQERHQHPDDQWTDVVLEGSSQSFWRYFINANVTATETVLDEMYLNVALGHQLQTKLGLFFSAFGRLNAQHLHDRDFVDAPIIYQRLFGAGVALQERGAQISAAITPTWIVGTEFLSATNREQFNHDDVAPRFYHLFSKWGYMHQNQLYSLLGASWATSQITTPTHQEKDTSWQAIDVTIKQWLSSQRYWMLQAEWLQRQTAGASQLNQSGYYVMGLYRLTPQWRLGLRQESAYQHTSTTEGVDMKTLPQWSDTPQKTSLLLEYDPSSWSRPRLQLGHESDNQQREGHYLLLGWQMGVHWLE